MFQKFGVVFSLREAMYHCQLCGVELTNISLPAHSKLLRQI